MDIDINRNIIAEKGKKYNFLLDTSTIIYLEIIWKKCGANMLMTLEKLPDINFFVTSQVLVELMSGKKGYSTGILGDYDGHILNSEGSFVPNWKENRFLIEQDCEVRYIVLNKISDTDYSQILMCQNHLELTLVTNDRKMLKSGVQVILGRRIFGIPAFLEKLIDLYPKNKRLLVIKETADQMFIKKNPFK